MSFVRDATVADETGGMRQSELPLALLGEGFRPPKSGLPDFGSKVANSDKSEFACRRRR